MNETIKEYIDKHSFCSDLVPSFYLEERACAL